MDPSLTNPGDRSRSQMFGCPRCGHIVSLADVFGDDKELGTTVAICDKCGVVWTSHHWREAHALATQEGHGNGNAQEE